MTNGIPFVEIPQLTEAERVRFWDRVDKAGGSDACWPWTGGTTNQGYGWIKIQTRRMVAHRLAFVLVSGGIAAGKQVDHLCHNGDLACPGGVTCKHRRCCNPAHLEAVTARTNTLRGRSLQAQNAAKTHCPQGHPLSGDNLRVRPSDGRRRCATCIKIQRLARSARESEAR